MNMWKKLKSTLSTPIPGSIVAASLTGVLLGTTMVLFTKLPVAPRTVPISVENTSGRNESLELVLILASGEELQVRVTGKSTMEVVQNLQRMLSNMDGNLLLEKSSPYTLHQDESTTRRHASSSFMVF